MSGSSELFHRIPINAIYNLLLSLEDVPFKLDIFLNDAEVKAILDMLSIERIRSMTYTARQKYIAKLGRKLDPLYVDKAVYDATITFGEMITITMIVRIVCSYYGITSFAMLPYISFARRLYRKLRRNHPISYEIIVNKCYDDGVRQFDLNPKVARVITLLTVKAYFYLQREKIYLYPDISSSFKPDTGEDLI